MVLKNPTPLRIGLSGTLVGLRYSIVGRVVISAQDQGQDYQWNEFHLRGPTGEPATLVHEETEEGVQWRLFVPLPVERSLTEDVASALKIGGVCSPNEFPVPFRLVSWGQLTVAGHWLSCDAC